MKILSIDIHLDDDEAPDTSSLADDCDCNCGVTCCDEEEPDLGDYRLALKEAQEDARIADERAEWYKRLAEERLCGSEKLAGEVSRQSVMLLDSGGEITRLKRDIEDLRFNLNASEARACTLRGDIARVVTERDALLAKLKDTTAALDRANAELSQYRLRTFWRGDGWTLVGK